MSVSSSSSSNGSGNGSMARVRADRVEGARREATHISTHHDGTLTSDADSLLGVSNGSSTITIGNGHHGGHINGRTKDLTSSTDELVGRICHVRGHDEAVLCTGKPVFFCFCFPWTFEYMLLRDGTSVRVLGLESSPGEQTVYRVQVIRSSTHVDDGMMGTIRGCWLVADNGNNGGNGGKNIESQSTNGGKNGRRPMTAAPFLAAMSRSAIAAVAPPSSSSLDASPEADLRDRISQILTTKSGHGHNNIDNTAVPSTSSVSLSMMSSSSSSSSSSSHHSTRGRPGLPMDGSTRISPGKADSKRPADERAQTGGVLPSISSSAASFDMDHSYKTPPGSPPLSSSRSLAAPTPASLSAIPLLPPPSDDITLMMPSSSSSSTPSHHTTIMVGATSTSISSTSISRQVDHPLHARYTAGSGGNDVTTTTVSVATATMTSVTPSATTSVNIMRATREEEKYPLMNGSSSLDDVRTPLSPTSAILAAIGNDSETSTPSRVHSHHRVTSSSLSSEITTMTLSTIDIESSSSSLPPSDVLSPTTAAVMSRVGANGASFANFRLPEGEIQAADIEAIVQLIAAGARDITYPLIFARLAGTKRLLSGDVLRPFLHELLNKANVQATQAAAARDAGAVGDVPREAMDVLWKLCAQIIDIRTGVDFLEINFNFGAGVRETTIKVPGTYTWVLDSKYKDDPLAVHALNKPKYHCSDARQLVIRNQVRFKMNATGIESVRDGDLGIKQIFKFNAGLRTEHKANTIEYDSLDRPFIEVRDGKPLIVDGHYVARRLNDWLVVNVLKKDVYIGLPDLAAITI